MVLKWFIFYTINNDKPSSDPLTTVIFKSVGFQNYYRELSVDFGETVEYGIAVWVGGSSGNPTQVYCGYFTCTDAQTITGSPYPSPSKAYGFAIGYQ